LYQVHFEADDASHENNMKKFDTRIAQADLLLQILIEQTTTLEERSASLEEPEMVLRVERMLKNYKVSSASRGVLMIKAL